jgi:iron complex outermembrane recepter protein
LSGNLEHASILQGGFDRETFSTTGRLSWSPRSDLQVVSVTNYLTLEKDYLEDAGGGFGFFPYNTIADFDQFSQELQMSGEGEKMRWQLGAYFLDMTWDLGQSVAGALILGGTSDTQRMETFSTIDSSNWSIYGQAEFDLTPELTLIGGLRWSQDDKEIAMLRVFQDVPQGVPPTEVFNIASVPIPGIDEIDYGDIAARLQLNWALTDDTLLYASFNRGIKGGNWSIDPLGAVANADLKHDEEVLHAYEIGSKTTFAGGRARLNAAVFYYDYDDYQTFSLIALTPQVANSDATAYGGELELSLSPTDRWEFGLGLALLDSEVDAVPNVFGGTVEAELPTAPSFSVNFLGRYEWPALGGLMSAQIDGNYNGDQYLEGTNSAVSFEDAYSVWNARAGYKTEDGRWSLALWVKNFTDEEYRLYNLDLGLLGFIEQVYAPPRWFGGSVEYRWE